MDTGLEIYGLHKNGIKIPVDVSLNHHRIKDDVFYLKILFEL